MYFDHNASTPPDERVLEAMLPYLRGQCGNPSSRHEFGTAARKAINHAREQVAAAVGVQPSQVIFVSGGSEANNLFLKGAAAMLKPAQIAVSAIEHPCVMKPAQELARSGWQVRKLAVDGNGVVQLDDVEQALQTPTGMMSLMLANNETGVIQPVAQVAARARAAGALMHSDAVQVFGKVAVDFDTLGVHALTLSSHKIYGPKGAGALIVDKRIELRSLISGGGQEMGLRAGTENVPAIVGFGAACELAVARMDELAWRCAAMCARLEQGLLERGAVLFGAGAARLPNTSYFAFRDIAGETLVIELDKTGYAVASGSACSAGRQEGASATLLAMGVAPELARGAVRISLGKDNDMTQIEDFLRALEQVLLRLRRLAAIAV
ncbi:MAG: cysteine desulfurase family protein [Pseudomonadota bacterium]